MYLSRDQPFSEWFRAKKSYRAGYPLQAKFRDRFYRLVAHKRRVIETAGSSVKFSRECALTTQYISFHLSTDNANRFEANVV